MKYIVSILLLMSMSLSSLYAGEWHETDSPYRDVEKLEWEFKVVLNDDKTITASWDDFPDNEGFLWYKLMYSTSNSAPVYPDQGAVFVGTKRTDIENTFKLKYGKKHYIRLCVVTEEEDYKKWRYCSDVKKLEVDNIGSVKKYTAKKTTVIKDYKEQKEVDKEAYKEKAQVKKLELSSQLKERIDAMLEKFMNRLESKGYSDDKKLEAIDRIISKLETLKEKNERYIRIVDYMMEVLQEYRSEIDDGLWEIESLFEDF